MVCNPGAIASEMVSPCVMYSLGIKNTFKKKPAHCSRVSRARHCCVRKIVRVSVACVYTLIVLTFGLVGPYFAHTTKLLHSGSETRVPGGTPDCVRIAYYTLCNFVCRYAEMDEPRFGEVRFQAWVNSGSKRVGSHTLWVGDLLKSNRH